MTRSGTGWPENTKKYKTIPVQLLTGQYDAIPQDVPVSQFVREAVEERLLREVPEYGGRQPADSADQRGNGASDAPGAAADSD